jgi:hypothetical protein
LEISGTLKLPSGATVEGITTYSDDLVLTGNSVIVQTNSATETNSLGNTNFNGTLVNLASSINQTNASATSALKNLTVVGTCVFPTITSPSIETLTNSITALSDQKANLVGNMELQSTSTTNYYMDWHSKNSNSDYDCRIAVDDALVPNTTGTSGLRFIGSNLNLSSNLSVSGNITGPTISAINTSIETKLNAFNPVLTGGCLITPSGGGGGVFSSSDTANRETGLYFRMFQGIKNRAFFVIGGTKNQYEWRRDTTTLMNLDGNANLSVVGNITSPTITSLTERLVALEGQSVIQPSIAGWGHTWGNSDTQRRQSHPIVSTTAFYGPLNSQNTTTVNPGLRIILYPSNSFTGVQNNIDNTEGTSPLSFFYFNHITFRSVQVYYKNVLVDLPNNAPL